MVDVESGQALMHKFNVAQEPMGRLWKVVLWSILVVVVFAQSASGATSISSCTTISLPGTYVLNQSIIDGNATTCINITSSDVIFNGAGYMIDGVDAEYTSGVYVYNPTTTLTNVTVKNLIVTDWYYGIHYQNASNGSIANNNAKSNRRYGIRLYFSSNETLTNNTANLNEGYSGILIDVSDYNTLTNNTANSNGRRGIYLSVSHYNIITNNTANLNSENGIYLDSSSNNSIYNNHLNNTNNSGFENLIYGNYWNTTKQAEANIIGGPYLGGNFWANPNGTSFSETCIDANSDGICDSYYNLAPGNVDYLPLRVIVADTTPPSVTLVSPTPANGSTLTQSYVYINVTANEPLSTALLDWNGVNENMSGSGTNWYLNKTNLSNGVYTYRVWANDSGGNLNVSGARTVTIASPTGPGPISFCTEISLPGTYVLNQSIVNSSETCIRIRSSSVTFDGAGYVIDGPNIPQLYHYGTYGVYVYNSMTALTNVTIKNLKVTDWYVGIYYNNTANGTIANNTASSNNWYGIFLDNSSSSTLTNNTANLKEYGIYLAYSGNNTLTNNNMSDNTYNFNLHGSQDSHFNNSIDTSNTVDGKPVYYIKNATNAVYDSSSNAGTFYCIWCNNATVKDLTLTKNGHGVVFWRTNNSRIENISASSNKYGIGLNYSSSNILTNNTASLNSVYGIHLFNSSSNVIYNNRFNNIRNFVFGEIYSNAWNTTKTLGTNIIGGPYLGGNFWANPNGTSFSETCIDANSDGICDSYYNLAPGNVDYLPLAKVAGQDMTPPTITFTPPTPTNGSTITQNYAYINITTNEPLSTALLDWNGVNESMLGSGMNWYKNKTNLSNGNYTYRVYANDSAGNSNVSVARLVTVDTTPPTITITSPQNTTYATTSIALNVSANEAISTWKYSLNGAANVTFTLNITITASEGANNIIVYANYTAGNWGSATRYFSVVSTDTTPPTITFASPTPANGSTLIQNYAYINVTLSEPGTALLDWNGVNESMSGSGTNWYLNKTNLSNGNYTYRVWANDSAGNLNVSGSRTIQVAVDITPPTITITSPQNTTYNISSVPLNFSAYDANGISWTGYSLDGGANVTSGSTTLSGLSDGPHSVRVWANDTAGNMNYSTVWFTISSPNTPVGTNVTVINETAGANVTFGNVTDGGTTIITATYDGPQPPSGFNLTSSPPTYYDITTTVNYTGTIEICIKYNESQVVGSEENLKLMHWNGTAWKDVTTQVDVDNNIVCGSVTGFSLFAVMEIRTVKATIDFDPETLNLDSKGEWVSVYIELPEGYDVADINVSAIKLNGAVSAEKSPTEVRDYDGDGIADLMVKFNRASVQDILDPGDKVVITVTGELTSGITFGGSDTIRVIEKGK